MHGCVGVILSITAAVTTAIFITYLTRNWCYILLVREFREANIFSFMGYKTGGQRWVYEIM